MAKIRRRLGLIIAGALLAALALVNVAPVSADDSVWINMPVDGSSAPANAGSSLGA